MLRYGYDLSYAAIGAALGSSEDAARQAASVRRPKTEKEDAMTVSPALDKRFREAAAAAGLLDVAYDLAETPIGTLLVATTERGLCRISFDPQPDREAELLAHAFGVRVLRAAKPIDPVRRQLDEYFEGTRTSVRAAGRPPAAGAVQPHRAREARPRPLRRGDDLRRARRARPTAPRPPAPSGRS